MDIKTITAALAAALALAGCGGTPGEAELREALRSKAIAYVEQMSGKKIAERDLKEIVADLQKVKLIECRKAGPENGFNCDWTGGEKFTMIAGGSHRILKTDAGWVLAAPGR